MNSDLNKNKLASVPTERIHEFEEELFEYLVASRDGLLASIRDTGVLSAEAEAELRVSVSLCLSKFLGNKE